VSLLQDDHAFELLEALLQESPADETELRLECVEERFVRFAPSGPTESADRECYEVAVRVRLEAPGGGFREARATAGTLDRDDLRAALGRAVTLARLATPVPDAPPLGGPVDVPGTAPVRPTQDHTFREKNLWIAAALARAEAEGLRAAGLARTLVANRTLLNSAGRQVHAARSSAALQVVAADRVGGQGGVASAQQVEGNVDRIDAEALIARAVGGAVRARRPVTCEPGAYDVVFAPEAVAALLGTVGFGAREYAHGRSLLTGRVGERMFPPALKLSADAGGPERPTWVFDGEGTPTVAAPLLTEGAFTGPVTDLLWAARLGRSNTGHAGALPSPVGPDVRDLTLAPGPSSFEELIAGVQRGLCVAALHGVAVEEPRDHVLSATTRYGVFRIDGGALGPAVADLRCELSLVEALTRVTGVGARAERVAVPGGGVLTVPALRIESVPFTVLSPT